jgi:hypothetical protein
MSSTTPLSSIGSPPAIPATASAPAALSERRHAGVRTLTEEIFGRPAAIRLEVDPEFGTPYFVVDVTVSGTADEIFELDQRWHRQLRAAASDDSAHYCLAIHFQS